MSFILTFTGRTFFPTNPLVDDIDIRDIAHSLSLTCRYGGHPPSLSKDHDTEWNLHYWHPMLPLKRHELPEYVPDVVAGSAAPVQLSRWKVAALKLCVLLEDGPISRGDLKALSLSPTRWTDRHHGWLQPTPQGYTRSTRMPDFPGQHPDVYAQIKADRSKWMFKREIAVAQRSLGLENE